FGYNRAFLLLAPVLAALLPLLPRPAMPLWLNSPAVAIAASKTGVAVLLPAGQISQAPAPTAEWSAWTWLGAIYLAGVALGLGRLAWQAGRLWVLARRLPREVRPGYVLAYTGGRLPTSSFGRFVFWDETVGLPLAEELAVLAHEWLVLPALGGLFFIGSHAALAQGGPVPSDTQQKANLDDIQRKLRAAMHQDSLRTGGKFEPGTMQQFTITNMNGKPGGSVVTVTRVPIKPAPPQPTTSTEDKVFTYVEQMPQLPGGGGQAAIVKTIRQNVEYPESMTKGNTVKG
nr:hypothetical protein [Tanacetum cinerariifolium]